MLMVANGDDEAILRRAIDNKETFDTGWIGCKKEIRSFRMISDGKVITIQAFAEMDDIPDLFYDALEGNEELTDEQLNELEEYWYADTEISTEAEAEDTVELTTYEDAMKILSKLEDSVAKQLDEWFEEVKIWVKEVVKATKED